MDADGQNLHQIFPNFDAPSGPEQSEQDHIKNLAWSPDGSKIAFEVAPPTETPHIWVMDTESGQGQPVSLMSGQQPAWSPDGQKLVVKACLPACGLWLFNLLGQAEQQLTNNSEDSYPAWSGLGYLAFCRLVDDSREIYLLRLPNNLEYLDDDWLAVNPPQRLTSLTGTATTPVFSPDGRRLYFRTDTRGGSEHWDIMLIRLQQNGGGPGKLVAEPVVQGIGPSNDAGLARPAVH